MLIKFNIAAEDPKAIPRTEARMSVTKTRRTFGKKQKKTLYFP